MEMMGMQRQLLSDEMFSDFLSNLWYCLFWTLCQRIEASKPVTASPCEHRTLNSILSARYSWI